MDYQRVEYAVPLYHYGSVTVPLTATTEEIREAIEGDVPKYVTLRVYEGVGQDADIVSWEAVDSPA